MDATGTRRIGSQAWSQQQIAAAQSEAESVAKASTSVAATDMAARWGMALIYLFIAYEWLISGLDKIFSSDFRSGLAGQLQDSNADNPHDWYVHFMNRVVIPHASGIAVAIEIGEILVAIGLIVGAVLWVASDRIGEHRTRTFRFCVIASLAGSAFMTANYYLMTGGGFPWVNTGAPFDEGISIDGLLTLMAIGLIGIEVFAIRSARVVERRSAGQTLESVQA